MHTRYRISLVSLALLALGSLTPPASAAQDAGCSLAAATAAADDQATAATRAGIPLTVEGKGQTQSLPFSLGGGAYTVTWSMSEPSTMLSFINLDAAAPLPGETESQQRLRSKVILNASGKDGSAGETHLYGVKPGTYYLGVRAPAGWSVTFTPLPV